MRMIIIALLICPLSAIKLRAASQPVQVLFIKRRDELGSSAMRADDPARMVNLLDDPRISARSVTCHEFQRTACQGSQVPDIVVHAKYLCRCEKEPSNLGINMVHVWDPVDALTPCGGTDAFLSPTWKPEIANFKCKLSRSSLPGTCENNNYRDGKCITSYILYTDAMKQRLKLALGRDVGFVVPEQHSNFANRSRDVSQRPMVVAIAGNKGNKMFLKNFAKFLKEQGNGLPDVEVKYLRDLPCNAGGSENSNCWVDRMMQVDVGVAWWQPRDRSKTGTPEVEDAALVEDSAQRLLNLLSVGVPAIGYSKYESIKEALTGARYLQTASDENTLHHLVLDLLQDAEKRKLARDEALEIAARFSPYNVGKIYRDTFLQIAQDTGI